jgi:TPR repeat protein
MAAASLPRLARLTKVGAFVALGVCTGRGPCQALMTATAPAQQMMSTRGTSVQKEIDLGNACLSGHGAPKDDKQAAYWFQKAADAGDPWAQQEIGFFYQSGIGVPIDPARAAHWYQLAAANGLIGAKINLGVAYLWGIGVPMDKQLAADLFRQAADHGSGAAATYLGTLYYFGQGVKQDRATAEHWYRVGAKLHDPLAAFDLGELFSVGDHPHNPSDAAAWFRKSIAGGYVPAIHSLAMLLLNHRELARSDHETIALFEEASAYGHWKSSEVLGILYRDGNEVARDPKAAWYYLQLAALQGAPTSRLESTLQLLRGELETEEITKQDSAARNWFQEHHEAIEFLPKQGMKFSPAGLAIVTPADGVHAGQIIALPPTLN